jgi:hypothetical protein
MNIKYEGSILEPTMPIMIDTSKYFKVSCVHLNIVALQIKALILKKFPWKHDKLILLPLSNQL